MSNFIKEIKSTLKDCKNSIKDYELSSEGGDYINQGWIEALEYVINTYNLYNNENNKIKMDIRAKDSLYININGWTYYIDDSTNEQITEKWKEDKNE